MSELSSITRSLFSERQRTWRAVSLSLDRWMRGLLLLHRHEGQRANIWRWTSATSLCEQCIEGQGQVTCAPDNHTPEEYNMTTGNKRMVALFVERSHQQWVVRDPEGHFWLLPAVENPWEHRQPFTPTPETELELVPGHYTSMLSLPFLNRNSSQNWPQVSVLERELKKLLRPLLPPR